MFPIGSLCTLRLSSKPDNIPSPITIVKLPRKKCQNNIRVIISPVAEI